MTAPVLYGLCGAALVGIGLYGLVAGADLLRRILGFNVVGSGVFLYFGSLAARHPTLAVDPVPQAMIITGIVVALAGTALAVAIAIRLHDETATTRPPGNAENRDARDLR
ncbi:cation:proton antiporter subunit C [Rhodopseudomonas palustris]|uniref:cation:proton antiporter subunit C n=1 Tax=Rhodopseudomonas palustris TaxID=1076 RepID=UPI002ACF00DF|nr:cation:proton antiporter subunit C [Rhodopseudomonas palustris]WQG99786.1 cation:proton antiporter subunit C [Rhodopseudomonas palustris]